MDPHKEPDPLVTREWYLLTFHECGHATWFAHGRYSRPLRIDGLEVCKKTWRKPPHGTGYTAYEPLPTIGQQLNRTKPPTMRQRLDWAAGALAGPAAEARWINLMDETPFTTALHHVYDTGGASDYDSAWGFAMTSGLFRRAERMAKAMVEAEWDPIVRMAKTTREQERLSGREIRQNAKKVRR